MPVSNNNKTIARNSIFMSIRTVITMLISLYTTRVVFQYLGVVDVGIYNVVCGFVTMFAFLNTTMANGIQRFYNFEWGRNKTDGAKKIFNHSLLIQFILAIIVVLLVEVIGLWYLHAKMVIPAERMTAAEFVFQYSVLSMFLIIMQAPFTAAIMAHEKMDFYALVSIIDAVLKLLIVLVLPLLAGDRLIVYGLLLFLINVFNFVLCFGYSRKRFDEIKFNFTYEKSTLKSMLTFSGWNVIGSFTQMLRDQGINVILNYFFGPVVNAAKGIASQVDGALGGFTSNIMVPARPQVIQSYAQGNVERAMNLTYCISKLVGFLMIMLAVPLSIEIDFILNLWLGENVPEHTNAFIIILLNIAVVNLLTGILATIVHATGEMKKYQLCGSIIKVMSVPVAIGLLYYNYPPEAALLSVLLFNTIGFFFGLFIIRTLVSFSIRDYCLNVLGPIALILCVNILSGFSVHSLMSYGFFRLIVLILVSMGVTMMAGYFLGLNSSEKVVVKTMANDIKTKIIRK